MKKLSVKEVEHKCVSTVEDTKRCFYCKKELGKLPSETNEAPKCICSENSWRSDCPYPHMKYKCCDGHTYKCGTGGWYCCLKCRYKLESEKIKSPPFNLEKFKESAQKAKETFKSNGLSQQIKDIVDEAYNANLDSEKITKAPVGASGVNTGSSKNYKSIIAWALKELDWQAPYWTHERKILNKIIKLAEQRGYERGLVEAHKNDPTGSELDDLLKRTEQEGYDRAKRELSIKYGGRG